MHTCTLKLSVRCVAHTHAPVPKAAQAGSRGRTQGWHCQCPMPTPGHALPRCSAPTPPRGNVCLSAPGAQLAGLGSLHLGTPTGTVSPHTQGRGCSGAPCPSRGCSEQRLPRGRAPLTFPGGAPRRSALFSPPPETCRGSHASSAGRRRRGGTGA